MLEWIKKKLEEFLLEPGNVKSMQSAIETEDSMQGAQVSRSADTKLTKPTLEKPLAPEVKQNVLRMIMKTLNSMQKDDALDQLVKKVKEFGPSREVAIYIVLDTSFLMLEKTPGVFEWLNSCHKHDLRTVYSVPDIVLNEVVSHFGTEKDSLARVARKRIAQLVEKSAEIESIDDLAPIDRVDSLSADSETDRKLINYALTKSDDHRFVCALIATDDGGIMYDVARYRRTGARIACLTKESTLEDIFEFICCWIAQSSKDDSLLRLIANAEIID